MGAHPEVVVVASAIAGAAGTNPDKCIGLAVDYLLSWPWLSKKVLADPARVERILDRVNADVKAAIEAKKAATQ